MNVTCRNQMLEECYSRVASVASRVARSVPGVEADDLVQDAYVRLLVDVPTFDPSRNVPFLAFVSTRAHYAMIQSVRDSRGRTCEGRSSRVFVSLDDHTDDSHPRLAEIAINADAHRECEAKQQRSLMLRALCMLSTRERLAVTLSHWRGMPLAEIGRRLGITAPGVCQLRNRAYGKLRALLTQGGY